MDTPIMSNFPERYWHLKKVDPEIHALLHRQVRTEMTTLKMIPSENFAQAAILEASGSILTNKYCEGYPGATVLRGERGRRPDRATGDRSGQVALRGRARQRAALFRLPGQPGRLPGLGQPGLQGDGHARPPGRPSDPRLEGQLLRHGLRPGAATARTPRPGCSTTTRSATSPARSVRG